MSFVTSAEGHNKRVTLSDTFDLIKPKGFVQQIGFILLWHISKMKFLQYKKQNQKVLLAEVSE